MCADNCYGDSKKALKLLGSKLSEFFFFADTKMKMFPVVV